MTYSATIVIPLLRQADDWLRRCVVSALNQSVPTETIVVRSLETLPSNVDVLAQLQRQFPNLSVLVEEKRGSFPNAINVGFRHARAERVGLLLSDDWLDENAVAECLREQADIVSSGNAVYFADGRINQAASRIPTMARFRSLPTLERKASYLQHFFLFRRDIVLRIPLDETIGNSPGIDDFDLIWTLLEQGATVAIVERTLYHYRDHDGERLSLSDPVQRIRNLEKILRKHKVSEHDAEEIMQRHARWFGKPIYKVMKSQLTMATMSTPRRMDIVVIVEGIGESAVAVQPWIFYKDALLQRGIRIHLYRGDYEAGFAAAFDAMLLHVWQDWNNQEHFNARRIMPLFERYAAYRFRFPQTAQIILNHTDMSRRPYATPYWRAGDPVLYRTPAYDRSQLAPFPPETIWPYENVWGEPCFASADRPQHLAGFIGSNSGPEGYRERVAAATARVGLGICAAKRPLPKAQHDSLMTQCRIVVCPRGWGENSRRHWDAWLSGKPVLTDRDCDSVEMIPGIRLRNGEHYLLYDDPDDIPDIVSDWTRPSRADDLAAIAENGRRAAQSYNTLERIAQFFLSVKPA